MINKNNIKIKNGKTNINYKFIDINLISNYCKYNKKFTNMIFNSIKKNFYRNVKNKDFYKIEPRIIL